MHLGFRVTSPGMLSLLQDLGRFGQHHNGLTTGGPVDCNAFKLANLLCTNDENLTAIEISLGGLEFESNIDTIIAVTGADMPFTINGRKQPLWQSVSINKGDKVAIGFAKTGVRSYLAVKGGFKVKPMFGSTSTVVREHIGGIRGDKLAVGDLLPCNSDKSTSVETAIKSEKESQNQKQCQSQTHNIVKNKPSYHNEVTLRVILGYQQDAFSNVQKQLFFSSEYQVSDSFDRMGYRLEGPTIKPNINGILSEGICLGAIQVPPNGQPIVLLNDRQTIGGYPKIGSVFSIDLAKLGQCKTGAKIMFEQISIEDAHNLLHLERYKHEKIGIKTIPFLSS